MRDALKVGGEVWRALVDAGGFVCTARDGKMSVLFNRGCRPTKELEHLVAAHRDELRMYVDALHRRADGESDPSPGQGTSAVAAPNTQNDKGHRNLLTNEKGENNHGKS